MEEFDHTPEIAPDWEQVRPVIDEALSELNGEDREALLLRFFKNSDFHSIGQSLGLSDDTAQKRVSRALQKLRTYLSSRGVVTTATALSSVLLVNAVMPATLAQEGYISLWPVGYMPGKI